VMYVDVVYRIMWVKYVSKMCQQNMWGTLGQIKKCAVIQMSAKYVGKVCEQICVQNMLPFRSQSQKPKANLWGFPHECLWAGPSHKIPIFCFSEAKFWLLISLFWYGFKKSFGWSFEENKHVNIIHTHHNILSRIRYSLGWVSLMHIRSIKPQGISINRVCTPWYWIRDNVLWCVYINFACLFFLFKGPTTTYWRPNRS